MMNTTMDESPKTRAGQESRWGGKMNLLYEHRNIWKNLLLAIGLTPGVALGGLFIVTIVGVLDDSITKIQARGHWWILLIVGFIVSLIYVIYAPKFHVARERKKFVSALILYWETQFGKQNKFQPSEDMIEIMQGELLERVKVWAWYNLELWSRFYPEEKYSEYPFGIVDSLMAKWQDRRLKVAGEAVGGMAGFEAKRAEYMLTGKVREKGRGNPN
jgi:hypothetical protein